MVRVLHLPAHTPYARKLTDSTIQIVNEASELDGGGTVPRNVSFGWLAQRRSLDFFDVLHIHSLELAERALVDSVLDRCRANGRGVVATVHDVFPMFETADVDGYRTKLRCLVDRGVTLVTLTAGAAARPRALLGGACEPTVLPHGYVIPPDEPGSVRSVGPPMRGPSSACTVSSVPIGLCILCL